MAKLYRKKPDFRTCFKKGRKFEELVTNYIKEVYNYDICVYTDALDQLILGESRARIELKYDRNYSKYKTYWIEVLERTNTSQAYVCSGIYREHSNFWCQGTSTGAHIFRRRDLVRLCPPPSKLIENSYGTSLAYLLGQDDINALSMRYLALSNLSKKKTWL